MKAKKHVPDELLSRYLDDEISTPEKEAVENHISECELCLNRMNWFNALHKVAQQLPEPEMKRNVWLSLDQTIRQGSDKFRQGAVGQANTVHSSGQHDKVRSRTRCWMVAAAIMLIFIIGGWLLMDQLQNRFAAGSETAAPVHLLTFDYGLYLSGLNEPGLMQQFNEGYKRQKVSLEEAESALDLKHPSDMFRQLPENISIEAVYLLDSGCCKCMQITLNQDGREFTVFRQPKKHPVEFTGYLTEHTQMDSAECTVVNADEHTAFAFDSENAKYIIVGHQHDSSLLAGLVARLTNP